MATYTSHYNLTKPEGTERVNIAIINQNMDSIDTQMYKNAQSIIANHGGMAIPSNNNTHAAVSSGQYVYVYNHSSLAEGTYVAKSAISTNGALSLSNLTAVPNGGLNHVYSTLNSNVANAILFGVGNLHTADGFSSTIPYPTGMSKTSTAIVGLMVFYNNTTWRCGEGINRAGTRLFASCETDGIRVYNDDPSLYGLQFRVLVSSLVGKNQYNG